MSGNPAIRASIVAILLAALLGGVMLLSPAGAAPRKPIKGIDVSRFQGRVGWTLVGKTDIRFAYLAASRGYGRDCTVVPEECGRDPWFDRNYGKARRVGLRVGAYHRAFPAGPGRKNAKRDARREANRFVAVVGKVRGRDLRPALDVEHPFRRLGERNLRVWIRTWAKRVERALDVKPIIYTNASSWAATGDTTWFATNGYPLWVANFDVPRPLVPAANWAGKGWTIWQYTSSGRIRGIDGAVDRNRLRKGFGRLNPR
ncbi:MAG TPA: glycoside hydrolase family 25 protein [Solirubrobacterales bacterium]|nr:glycoside hydrolase family 25 protein [Solirubrobacterales bacterium]